MPALHAASVQYNNSVALVANGNQQKKAAQLDSFLCLLRVQ